MVHSFCMVNTYSSHTQTGETPLWIASQEGHSDTVSTLIRNGADVNLPRNVGRGGTYGTLVTYSSHIGWWNPSGRS